MVELDHQRSAAKTSVNKMGLYTFVLFNIFNVCNGYVCIPSTTRCTSLSSLLFILIFIKSHILFFAHPICFAHLTVLLFCTFLYSIAHFTSYFFFLPIYIYIYIYSCVVLLLYNLILTLLFIFYIYIFFF